MRSIDETKLILAKYNKKIAQARQADTPPSNSAPNPTQLPRPQTQPHRPLVSAHQPLFQPPTLAPHYNILASRIASVIPHALAKSTSLGYNSTIRRFLAFCDSNNVPPKLRFPTDEEVLSSFAASFATRASGGSASCAIAALKTWHSIHDVPWKGGQRLAYVLKAVSNLAPDSSHRPERPGVSIPHLSALAANLILSDPRDAAIFATATVAFWGICRLGELLGSSRRKHDPHAFPSRSSLNDKPTHGTPLYLHLPRTKTSQTAGATIRIPEQHGNIDPFRALANHLRINYGLAPHDHLFAFHSRADGTARCLTKEVFIKRCNDIWSASGLQQLSGHNFRIGGANIFIDEGVPSDIVKAMGRWKSAAYYKYWRKPHDKSAPHADFILRPHRRTGPSRTGRGRLAQPVGAA